MWLGEKAQREPIDELLHDEARRAITDERAPGP